MHRREGYCVWKCEMIKHVKYLIYLSHYDDVVDCSTIIYAVSDADTYIVFWLDIQHPSLCEYTVHNVYIYILCTIYRNRNPKTSCSWLVNPPPLTYPPTKIRPYWWLINPLVSLNNALLKPYFWGVYVTLGGSWLISHNYSPPRYIHIAPRPDFAYKDGQVQPMVSWAKTKPNFALKNHVAFWALD